MKAQTILTPLHSQIITFLEHINVERNLSQLTVRNYRHYLTRFADWFVSQNREDITQMALPDVLSYRVYLSNLQDEQGRVLSRRTQGYHIIALRSFLKWLIKNDIQVLPPEKIDLPKSESYSMKFLDSQQIERLLSQPSISTLAGLRDKAILELLYSTGLRVSELVSLNREQVDTNRREFGVIGKGRKARVVFLSENAASWLDRYLSERKDTWDPVFIHFSQKNLITQDGEAMRLTSRSVQRIVGKYCKKAHLPIKITPHGIRHSFATDLLQNGAGLRDVQEMLGHKNIATTQIYTHVTRADLKQVYEKYHDTKKEK